MVTYYPTNDAKQAIVSYSTAPGEGLIKIKKKLFLIFKGNIYRLKDYERRFASKISVWIGFLLLAMPTTVLPFIIWFLNLFIFQKFFFKVPSTEKVRKNANWSKEESINYFCLCYKVVYNKYINS